MTGVTWSQRPARVRAPATSANLGPGFDALGLALALYDEVEARVTDGGLAIEVSGEGSETAAAGERHLVVRAMRADPALATTPVVIVSSERSQARIDELRREGARAYVKKPFRPEQFREVVEALLGGAGGGHGH